MTSTELAALINNNLHCYKVRFNNRGTERTYHQRLGMLERVLEEAGVPYLAEALLADAARGVDIEAKFGR